MDTKKYDGLTRSQAHALLQEEVAALCNETRATANTLYQAASLLRGFGHQEIAIKLEVFAARHIAGIETDIPQLAKVMEEMINLTTSPDRTSPGPRVDPRLN